jgi:hypothetical protein
MSIELLNLHPDEAERIAYAENFNAAAKLFARVADAQNKQYFAIEHLKAVLKAATEGDTAQMTRAVFSAYVFLEKIGHNIDPANTLEHTDNG